MLPPSDSNLATSSHKQKPADTCIPYVKLNKPSIKWNSELPHDEYYRTKIRGAAIIPQWALSLVFIGKLQSCSAQRLFESTTRRKSDMAQSCTARVSAAAQLLSVLCTKLNDSAGQGCGVYPEALPHRTLSKCFSSIDQRHIDVGQINHMPVEAHLKTGCMLRTGKSGNRFSVLRNQFEHLDRADRSEQILQLCFSCRR